jgi:hypothetical protein
MVTPINGYIVKDGGDKFDVKINAPYDTELLPEIRDNKDGTYEVLYKVTIYSHRYL